MLQPIPHLLHDLPEVATANDTWIHDYLIGTALLTLIGSLAVAPLPDPIPRWVALIAAFPAILYILGYLHAVTDSAIENSDALPAIRGADHSLRLRDGLIYLATLVLYSPPVLLFGFSLIVTVAFFEVANPLVVGLVAIVPLLVLAVPLVALPLYVLPIAVANAAHTDTPTAGLRFQLISTIATSNSYLETAFALLGVVLIAAPVYVIAIAAPLVGVPLAVGVTFGVLVSLHMMAGNEFRSQLEGDEPLPANR